MEQEYARKEKAKSFDRSMLKVLMVEFMRDTNIPFIMIDNTKLRTILHFLRPDIALPCCAELLQLNVTEMATFQLWERSIKIAKGWSASDRADAVAAVNHERIKMVQKDAHIYDEQMSARAGASTLNSPSIFPSTSTIKNVKDVMKNRKQPEPQPPILEKGVKEEPFSEDYEEFAERKPTGEELLIGAQNSGHLINKVKEEEIEPPSKVPRHDNEGTTAEQNTEVSPESLAAIPTTMTGLSTYPCLVCLERVESYKVRSVTINDGFFMIYLGLKEGYYTMDTAKEAARYSQFGCCVSHHAEICDLAFHHLQVVDPKIDVHAGNKNVISAFHTVNALRSAKYINDAWFKGARKNPIPFCANIRSFFTKYYRENYVNFLKRN